LLGKRSSSRGQLKNKVRIDDITIPKYHAHAVGFVYTLEVMVALSIISIPFDERIAL
jgi:hypothetical protein